MNLYLYFGYITLKLIYPFLGYISRLNKLYVLSFVVGITQVMNFATIFGWVKLYYKWTPSYPLFLLIVVAILIINGYIFDRSSVKLIYNRYDKLNLNKGRVLIHKILILIYYVFSYYFAFYTIDYGIMSLE